MAFYFKMRSVESIRRMKIWIEFWEKCASAINSSCCSLVCILEHYKLKNTLFHLYRPNTHIIYSTILAQRLPCLFVRIHHTYKSTMIQYTS